MGNLAARGRDRILEVLRGRTLRERCAGGVDDGRGARSRGGPAAPALEDLPSNPSGLGCGRDEFQKILSGQEGMLFVQPVASFVHLTEYCLSWTQTFLP